MATMRESTSLLMAATDGGINLHSWAISHPPTAKELALEKKRKQAMLAGLGFLLTCGIAVLLFLFFHPASFVHQKLHNHHRHLLSMEDPLEFSDFLTLPSEMVISSTDWLNQAGVVINTAQDFSSNNEVHMVGEVMMDKNGMPVDVVSNPIITVTGDDTKLYTLVMIDLGNPSSLKEGNSEYLLWSVLNIPGGSSPAEGLELVSFNDNNKSQDVVPKALLVLFQQSEQIASTLEPPTRFNFSLKDFAARFSLGNPTAAFYL